MLLEVQIDRARESSNFHWITNIIHLSVLGTNWDTVVLYDFFYLTVLNMHMEIPSCPMRSQYNAHFVLLLTLNKDVCKQDPFSPFHNIFSCSWALPYTICNKCKHHLVAFKEFWLPSQLQSCTYIWLRPAGNPPFQKSHIIKQVISTCLWWF